MVLASAHTLDTGRSFRLLLRLGAFGAADEAAATAELALDEADFRDDDDDGGIVADPLVLLLFVPLLLDLPLVLDDDDDVAAVSLPAVEMNPSSPSASKGVRDDNEEE